MRIRSVASGPTARLIGPDDPAWLSFLAATEHDVYHMPCYVEASAIHEGGDPRALLVTGDRNGLLLPLIRRDIPGGGQDATSPYGYPGPILRHDDPAFLDEAMLEGARLLRQQGFISLFVRSHPILCPALPSAVGTVVEHGPTVAVDLSLPEDVLWSQLRKSHRRDIERAVEAGCVVARHDDDETYRTFVRLYGETMARVGADAFYRFDEAYFQALRDGLAGQLRLGTVSHHGQVISAGLYTAVGGIVQAHLAATDPRCAADTAPATKLLDWSMLTWSQARGCSWFSLGGGRGGNPDSLLQYKEGFSQLHRSFSSLRVVLDPERYRRLVDGCCPDGDPSDLTGYFPLYRKADPGP